MTERPLDRVADPLHDLREIAYKIERIGFLSQAQEIRELADRLFEAAVTMEERLGIR